MSNKRLQKLAVGSIIRQYFGEVYQRKSLGTLISVVPHRSSNEWAKCTIFWSSGEISEDILITVSDLLW